MISLLGKSWVEAGADLGFRVTAPFMLETQTEQSFSFDALINEFGSTRGMLLMSEWNPEKAKAASECGYGYSCIGVGAYERSGTIEVLQDWGWCSSKPPPPWL